MADIRPETNFDTQCNLFNIEDIEIPKPEEPEKLDFKDLTSNVFIHREDSDVELDYTVKGDGMFDDMMETVTKHIKAQFMANRLREEDYAQVYTDIVKHTMSLCFDAWLKKAQIEAQTELLKWQAAQIELNMKKVPYEIKKIAADTEHVCELTIHERIKERHTESQILLTDAQTENTQEQTIHERIKEDLTREQICLTHQQCLHEERKILLTDAQTCLVSKQCEHEELKMGLTEEQICVTHESCEHETSKRLLTEANTEQVKETTIHEKLKEELTEAQTCVTQKQCEHEVAKKGLTEANTSNVSAQTTKLIPSQVRLNDCQAEKACAEVELVNANTCKATFECSKTLPKQIEVMDCQKKLYCNQADKTIKETEETEAKKALYMRQVEGYDENFLKDILKIQADAWNVGFSVSKDTFMAADGIPIIMQTAEITNYFKKWIEPNLDRYSYGRINLKGTEITQSPAPK